MRTPIGIIGIAAIGMSPAAAAHTLYEYDNAGRTDTRVAVGVTIPLGSSARKDRSAPRFDFRVESARISQNRSFNPDIRDGVNIGWQPQRKSAISLTLQDQPRLMLNGRFLTDHRRLNAGQGGQDEGSQGDGDRESEESKEGEGTFEKIATGAAIAGGAVAALAAVSLGVLLVASQGDMGE